MKHAAVAIVAAMGLIALSNAASAQSNDIILQRLGRLEQANAKIEQDNAKLERENAALRDRVRRLEGVPVAARAEAYKTPKSAPPMTVKAVPAVEPIRTQPRGWAGFYFGAHGGYGWSREDFEHGYDPTGGGLAIGGAGPANFFYDLRGQGAVFGGQFGYNWQPYTNWVVGLEADFSITKIENSTVRSASQITFPGGVPANETDTAATATVSNKIRDLGTLRGKVGFTPRGDILVYGTGGLSWGQVSQMSTGTTSVTFPNPNCGSGGGTGLGGAGLGCGPNTTSSSTFSNTSTQFGWAAGAGADWKIGDNLMLGLLYLHYDLGKTPSQNPSNGSIGLFPSADVTVDTVTARLNWLFASDR